MSTNSFETIVKGQVADIKEQLRGTDSICRFEFTIKAEGRLDGEVSIHFGLGEYGTDVRGDSVSAVVQEFLRRHGWNERHAPLCLPNVSVDPLTGL